MSATRRALLLPSIVCLLWLPAFGQDAPSLGETARKTRQQEQAQPGNAPAAKAVKVVKDEDAPQPPREPASSSASGDQGPASNAKPGSGTPKRSAAEWKAQILAQKTAINAMQAAIDKLNDSIQFAPGNCVAGCVQWNERQKDKQQQVERARAQLEEQKKRLAEMQEAARQQGYGGSVYDP